MLIQPNMTVLFQGDSITDVGRDRETDDLGRGYARIAAGLFTAKYPNMNVTFLNKGISGNRTSDLLARWEEDCLALKPDFLSILIGINDTWRRFDSNSPTTAEQYESNYRTLLTQVRERLGDIPVLLIEPFLMPFVPDKLNWREDLDPKIHAARKMAQEFHAHYLPLDGLFASKSIDCGYEVWSADGVHPSLAGHTLIAQEWLKLVEEA